MKIVEIPRLRELPKEIRLFALLVMTVLAIGYAHALVYVYETTHIVPKGIEERYRGTEQAKIESMPIDSTQDAPPIQYEKSFAEMLNIVHTHILTMSLIFFVSGLITFFTRAYSARFRKFIILEPFVGIILTFLGLWLTRYAHPSFSWLVSFSGAVMALAFAAQYFAVVVELISKTNGHS